MILAQARHLLAQVLTGFHDFLRSFSVSSSHNLFRFFRGVSLGFIDQVLCTTLCISQQSGRFVAGFSQLQFHFFVRVGQFNLGMFGSSQTMGNFF